MVDEEIYTLLNVAETESDIMFGISLAHNNLNSEQIVKLRIKLNPIPISSERWNIDRRKGWFESHSYPSKIFFCIPNRNADEIKLYL